MPAVVLTREYVDVPVGERAMRTFVARPAAAGACPGIVFYTDIFQLTESSLRWAVRLAGYGFLVAVPEIYHRVEPAGTVLGFDDPGKVRGQADAEAITDRRVRRGHRGGARLAERRVPERRRRGTLHGRASGVPGGVRRARARHRVLVPDRPARRQARQGPLRRAGARRRDRRRAAADLRHARPAHAAAAAARPCTRRSRAGATFTWHEFDAEHAFGRDIGPRFDPEATDAAFAETVAFFRRTL